ncbi:helix-turn-helix transcriptional regulator [Aliarcobacter skirrowii]|uniref:helix-turn-helix domain-containing protein n=1 Tax=Aliarcobacter skirrowii TaxID=28200 RepID=UPI0029B6BE30|nr:helix-turn-helix transcriptional regulator [Aliarcobacter skirrowii]MDX4062198.1 helix-turn-helix transcriptional regulator [Aliarcobacter skirrowii]
MINKCDAELSELLGVSRVSVTRWRIGQRYPKFDEVVDYEDKLGFPFECFTSREPDLEAIKTKLELQLKAVKKAIKDKEKAENETI